MHSLAWLPNAPDVEHLLTHLMLSRMKSLPMLTRLSQLSTLLSCLMAVTSTMHQPPRQIRTSAIKHMVMSRTSLKTFQTLWQHANVTLAALKHTAFGHPMAVNSVDLAILNHYNPILLRHGQQFQPCSAVSLACQC